MAGLGRITSASLAAVFLGLSFGIASAESPDKTASTSPASSCARADFRVVLDVGHTAESPGAKSARGVDEYVFNLRLAKRINQTLLDAGFTKTVLMVTDGPGIKSMYVRVARANDLGANLLLSIHHDSVPDRFLEKWDYNGKPETFSDRFKGHSIFISDDNVDPKDSLIFGSMLGQQLKLRGLQYTPHYTESFMGRWRRTLLDAGVGVYRYDTLFVLKKTHMPAVLLEAGSIANRNEELLLDTPEHQQLISAAVVNAVDSFCATQSNKSTQVAQSARRTRNIAHHSRRHVRERTVAAAPIAQAVQSSIDAH